MAQRVITQLVDDLDGTELADGEGTTLRFGLEGVAYEIDLSDKNARKLRKALDPYVSAARRVNGGSRSARQSRGPGSKRDGGSKEDLTAIREWARANGHEVSGRGRISSTVLQAYDAAH